MTDPLVIAIGPHQLIWAGQGHTHATVRLHQEGEGDEVMSVQPDGRIEARPAGTCGPYELALVQADRLIFAPKGAEGNVFILPYTSVLP